MLRTVATSFALAAVLTASGAAAQPAPPAPAPARPATPPAPPAAPIGAPISQEDAQAVVAAAHAEAARRGVKVTFAIVEPGGELVYFEKASGAPYFAEDFAVRKARAAARYRRATSYDAARLANNDPALNHLPQIFPFPGGQPIVKNGQLIGAVGVTGGADDDVAIAAAKAIK